MAITTITISGKVVKPNATAAPGGRIDVILAQGSGTVDDGGVEQVVSPSFTAIIGAAGDVSFEIIPTDIITVPEGGAASYLATYHVDGETWREEWAPTGVSNLDIGDLPLIVSLVGDARLIVITVEANLPTPSSSYRQWEAYLNAGTGLPDKHWKCMKDGAEAFDWVLVSSG